TPAYHTTVSGATATMTHRTSQQSSWSVSLTSEHDSSGVAPEVLNDSKLRATLIALGLDPTTSEQNGQQNSIGFDLKHSTADNLLNAHRGYQLTGHVEQAGIILPGSFKYSAITLDGRHYLPLGDNLVFASRLQAG